MDKQIMEDGENSCSSIVANVILCRVDGASQTLSSGPLRGPLLWDYVHKYSDVPKQ